MQLKLTVIIAVLSSRRRISVAQCIAQLGGQLVRAPPPPQNNAACFVFRPHSGYNSVLLSSLESSECHLQSQPADPDLIDRKGQW